MFPQKFLDRNSHKCGIAFVCSGDTQIRIESANKVGYGIKRGFKLLFAQGYFFGNGGVVALILGFELAMRQGGPALFLFA